MAGDVVRTFGGIDPRTINVAEIVGKILPRGHVIHGYSSAISERVIKILASVDYSDRAPLLGFGVDGSAERALARALLTYAMREEQGLDYIEPRQYPETDQAQIVWGRNNSRFDNIVWGGDFKLFQDGTDVVANSSYGGGFGMSPLEVRASGPLEAILSLTDAYQFMNDRVAALPAISLD